MKKYKILVTGAAGFIGSHLTNYLINKSHKVYTADDLSGGYFENINKKSLFTKIDLTNSKETESYISKIHPQVIFHLAADASEGRSQFTPLSSTKRNYLAYLNTLVPAIKSGFKKIIVFSSMSVYGSQKPPFSEKTLTKPDDIYGVSKDAMEKATKILSQVHGFEYIIIRPHNVYGPRQNMADPYRNVITIFINRLLQNKNFYIYGNGNQKRSFTYIDDCIPYVTKTMSDKFKNETFNIGPLDPITINELSVILLTKFFKKELKDIPKKFLPVYLPPRPVEVINAYCTMDKAQRLLNFKQNISLEKGIEETLEWAVTKGCQKFRYLDSLEIMNSDTPQTWTKKLI